jgi:hypothetical protein
MAAATGLEPAICSVTESYVNQLHHATSEQEWHCIMSHYVTGELKLLSYAALT